MKNPFKNISDSGFIQGMKSLKIQDMANGGYLLRDWLLRQGKWVFLVVLCTFFYMNNRMVCEKMLKRIDELHEELEHAKYISTIKETELLRAGRQIELEKLIEERGLNLSNPDMPPYKIHK
ncbi:MAG: med21 domain-containing protein [Paludibacteraceae bacterium]|nr:med21 domain-containing protein [Paludibacteraceae bacterium]